MAQRQNVRQCQQFGTRLLNDSSSECFFDDEEDGYEGTTSFSYQMTSFLLLSWPILLSTVTRPAIAAAIVAAAAAAAATSSQKQGQGWSSALQQLDPFIIVRMGTLTISQEKKCAQKQSPKNKIHQKICTNRAEDELPCRCNCEANGGRSAADFALRMMTIREGDGGFLVLRP
ncbi:hypothetical protein Ancab_007360 [Ancistrocladus abbreviatus]